jgi:hypothetical protein
MSKMLVRKVTNVPIRLLRAIYTFNQNVASGTFEAFIELWTRQGVTELRILGPIIHATGVVRETSMNR